MDALRSWANKFRITLVAVTALLLILRLFTDNKLPMDARTLLKTDRLTEIINIEGGEYLHFGLKRAVLSIIRENKKQGKSLTHLKLIINVDGLPIFKSTQESFFLILCSEKNSKKVYPIGAFFGRHKPTNPNEFLKRFVDEALELQNFYVNEEKISVSIECLTADTPAKAFILFLKGHTGYDSCTKCNIKGEYFRYGGKKNSKRSGVVCFSGTGPFQLRRDEDFLLDDDSTPQSILTKIPGFGLVSSVPLDYMHLVLLGVVKRLITLWLAGPLKVRLSARKICKLSKKLLKLRLTTPKEFSRRPRTILDYKFWKATEFRTFLLYTGPIALKNIVSSEVYSHFLLLHSAITILVNEKHLHVASNINYADELLNQFVKDFSTVYGKQYVCPNVHNLFHICIDVRIFDQLDNYSSFRFENCMTSLKKMIRKGEKPLQQLARRYSELESAEMSTISNDKKPKLKQPHFSGPLTSNVSINIHQFKIFESETYTIDCNKPKDSAVILKDGNLTMLKAKLGKCPLEMK